MTHAISDHNLHERKLLRSCFVSLPDNEDEDQDDDDDEDDLPTVKDTVVSELYSVC